MNLIIMQIIAGAGGIAIGCWFVGRSMRNQIPTRTDDDHCYRTRNDARFHCRTLSHYYKADEAQCLDRWKLNDPICWENEA